MQNPEVQVLALHPVLKDLHRTGFPLSLLLTLLETGISNMSLHLHPWFVLPFVCNEQVPLLPPPVPATPQFPCLDENAPCLVDLRSFLWLDPSVHLPRGIHPSPPRTSIHPTHHQSHIVRLCWKGVVNLCLQETRIQVRCCWPSEGLLIAENCVA